MTLGAVLFLGFVANRAAVLSDEVASRKSAEDRLKVLIHELNHRVRNVMAVTQAVVRLSFTPGLSLSEIQKTCEGRLQALAKAMSILTASDWKSVGLRSLISDDILPVCRPHRDRGAGHRAARADRADLLAAALRTCHQCRQAWRAVGAGRDA